LNPFRQYFVSLSRLRIAWELGIPIPSCGSIGICRHLEAFGGIWRDHLVASGGIWRHLEASGDLWGHLEASGGIVLKV